MERHSNYIQVKSPINWDEYFMLQAMLASFRSKDPSTQVGCVLVDQNNHQISMGYNGFVAGIDETKLPWGKDDAALVDQKYGYVVHAESNAILHSTKSLEGARAYVTLFPCHECAKMMASKKIKEVVYLSDKHADRDYAPVAKRIFEMSGITTRAVEISEDLVDKLHQYLKNFPR